MADSSSFTNGIQSLNSLSTSLNQYVVTPLQAFGLGGFVFDIEGEARVELNNEITDHYVENNSVVQDHIAVKPKKVVLRNYVGELVYPAPSSSILSTVNTVTQKLTQLGAFLPALAAGASQANSIYTQSQAGTLSGSSLVAAGAGAAANLYGLVKNLISSQSNKQQAAYQYFKAMRDTRQIFSIQTPFEFMTNMAIESLVAIQPEESIYISNFVITLKEIRVASTTTVKVGAGSSAGNLTSSSNSGLVAGLTNESGGGVYSSAAAAQAAPLSDGNFVNIDDLSPQLQAQASAVVNNGTVPGVAVPEIGNVTQNSDGTFSDDGQIVQEQQAIAANMTTSNAIKSTGVIPPGTTVYQLNENFPTNK